jgi:hypothetical protein
MQQVLGISCAPARLRALDLVATDEGSGWCGSRTRHSRQTYALTVRSHGRIESSSRHRRLTGDEALHLRVMVARLPFPASRRGSDEGFRITAMDHIVLNAGR